jgi:hypothetical protein
VSVKICGVCDDVIGIDGDIQAEWYPRNTKAESFVVVSNGAVVGVRYSDEGCWIVRLVHGELCTSSLKQNKGHGSEQYSDILEIHGDIIWAVHGQYIARNVNK